MFNSSTFWRRHLALHYLYLSLALTRIYFATSPTLVGYSNLFIDFLMYLGFFVCLSLLSILCARWFSCSIAEHLIHHKYIQIYGIVNYIQTKDMGTRFGRTNTNRKCIATFMNWLCLRVIRIHSENTIFICRWTGCGHVSPTTNTNK